MAWGEAEIGRWAVRKFTQFTLSERFYSGGCDHRAKGYVLTEKDQKNTMPMSTSWQENEKNLKIIELFEGNISYFSGSTCIAGGG
jgi:hypothetical protein